LEEGLGLIGWPQKAEKSEPEVVRKFFSIRGPKASSSAVSRYIREAGRYIAAFGVFVGLS